MREALLAKERVSVREKACAQLGPVGSAEFYGEPGLINLRPLEVGTVLCEKLPHAHIIRHARLIQKK